MDPIIEEMSQARPPIRPDVFARWVEHLQKVVQVKLTAYEALVEGVKPAPEWKGAKR